MYTQRVMVLMLLMELMYLVTAILTFIQILILNIVKMLQTVQQQTQALLIQATVLQTALAHQSHLPAQV